MDSISERVLPQSNEAEASVLGAVLKDNSVLGVVARMLKPDYFYSAANRMVFEAMINLFERQGAVDLVLLNDEMERLGTLERCGGASFLSTLEEGVTPANVEFYSRMVRDRAFMRNLVGVCTDVTDTLCDSGSYPSRMSMMGPIRRPRAAHALLIWWTPPHHSIRSYTTRKKSSIGELPLKVADSLRVSGETSPRSLRCASAWHSRSSNGPTSGTPSMPGCS